MVKRSLQIEMGLYHKLGDGQMHFYTLVEVSCGYHPLQILGALSVCADGDTR